jgi:hypothetical protein
MIERARIARSMTEHDHQHDGAEQRSVQTGTLMRKKRVAWKSNFLRL